MQKQKPARQVLKLFTPLPQILKNVKLPSSILELPEVKEIFEKAGKKLGENGRLMIRPSGTESLIRVMAEGENEKTVKAIVDSIVKALMSLPQQVVA